MISQRRLARAAHLGLGRGREGHTAAEVLGNVEAMRKAVEIGVGAAPLTVDDLIAIHRLLLRFADDHGIAGVVRTAQNWIGGSGFNPLDAAFVPPPPEHVPELPPRRSASPTAPTSPSTPPCGDWRRPEWSAASTSASGGGPGNAPSCSSWSKRSRKASSATEAVISTGFHIPLCLVLTTKSLSK